MRRALDRRPILIQKQLTWGASVKETAHQSMDPEKVSVYEKRVEVRFGAGRSGLTGWRSIRLGTAKPSYRERSWTKLRYAGYSLRRANLGLPLVAVRGFGPDKRDPGGTTRKEQESARTVFEDCPVG
jgi:hypothetical protein